MICNSALLRSSLGFFVGCIFYLAAAICESCFAVAAFSAVKADDFDEEKLLSHKQRLRKIIAAVCAVIVAVFTVTLPLLLGGVYVGIDAGDWLSYALVFLGILAAAVVFVSWIVRVVLGKKGKIKISENEINRNKLKIKVCAITTVALLLTTLIHSAVYANIPAYHFAKGTVHKTVEEFKEYIETPVPYSGYYYDIYEEAQTQTIVEEVPDDGYYTDFEKEWQDSLKQNEEVFLSPDGKEVFRYSHMNENVVEIAWGDSENGMPVTTYTVDQIRQRTDNKNLVIHGGFMLIYIAEILAGVVVYRKKEIITVCRGQTANEK